MHEHKQNQCKRKVKHRKNMMGLIIFCITVGIAFMFTYYQNLRKEISARQKWLETVLTGEKKWILENQGPEGEIYMNGSKAGDVNPYFACVAALGLLTETKNCPMTETEKKAVGRYLDWHTGILLETDGKMGIYRKESCLRCLFVQLKRNHIIRAEVSRKLPHQNNRIATVWAGRGRHTFVSHDLTTTGFTLICTQSRFLSVLPLASRRSIPRHIIALLLLL